jgi:hypothetical protein
MQEDFRTLLRKAISHERLEAYRQRGTNGDDLNLFAHYAWNVALCESLYPTLQGLEVALRNSINDAATTAYRKELWYDDSRVIPHPREQEAVRKAKDTLIREGKPHEAGRIIAELNFGFWTSLFDVRYEQILWPRLLKAVFPFMPRTIRTRKTLSKRLHRIRHLRNRVFHHEPIWYWRDLIQQHDELREAIGWINPAMLEMIGLLDRFTDVYRRGVESNEEKLRALMQKAGDSSESPRPGSKPQG